MASFKLAFLGVIVLMATAVTSAQQKFPLRSGEWSSTTPDPTHPASQPMTLLFCMNDETWTKALNGNSTCSMQQLSISPLGATYSLSCPAKAYQMKGNFKITFDGMTHMTSSGSMDMTVNGKTMHTDSTSDFHWKGPTCDPNADMNLKFKQH
jgi:Protein of unknown function (DUF3617)